jgi:predicted AAA+ superfamily ATPase
LLDTAGLLAGIENFTTDKVTQRASSPKFQVYNNALLSVQRNESFSEALAKPELWGRMVESSVGGYLINQSFAVGYKVYYWRHRSDEVDFVLERRGKVIGIEVKSGHRQKLTGLKAFNEIFHPDKTLLVGKDGMPWQEFLLMPLAQLF